MAVIEPKQVTLKNGQKACLRSRTGRDTENVFKFLDRVFADDRFFLTTLDEIRELRSFEKAKQRAELFNTHDNKLMLVTEMDEQIISLSDIECGEKQRNCHIGQVGISILPAFRGVGLGTAIMETMIDWAAAHPLIEKLALGVWAANQPAIGLYQKMGFIEEGRKVREVKYADGSYDDCICMYHFV